MKHEREIAKKVCGSKKIVENERKITNICVVDLKSLTTPHEKSVSTKKMLMEYNKNFKV